MEYGLNRLVIIQLIHLLIKILNHCQLIIQTIHGLRQISFIPMLPIVVIAVEKP